MHVSLTKHVESLDLLPSHIWPSEIGSLFRPSLNIRALCEILEPSTQCGPLSPSATSKKRFRPLLDLPNKSSKRSKGADGSGTRSPEELEDNWPVQAYPSLPFVPNTSYIEPMEVVPVIQRIYRIRFSKSIHRSEVDAGWLMEEQNLREILAELQSHDSETRTVHLGDAKLIEYHGRLVACSATGEWLFLIPSVNHDIDLEWHHIASRSGADILLASYKLQSVGRASVQAQLEMVFYPEDIHGTSEATYPFEFQVTVNVSLLLPAVFEPFPRYDKNAEMEGAQRLLGEYLWPSNAVPPDSYTGVMNISYFYSILSAPPPLLAPELHNFFQPPSLMASLLPFQRRSVAWMLGREGKVVSPSGNIVPKQDSTLSAFSFWHRVEEGDHTWYINRLSGVFSPFPPAPNLALGGILAEEPGLGKTLETITLIMLNPAPLERNPTLRKWVPEAGLNVSAIKTTLIVTPFALASQWVDELAAHAPELKVMVYEGWSKVPVPLTKTQAMEVRRFATGKAITHGTLKPRITKKSRDEDMDSDVTVEANYFADDLDDWVQDWPNYVNGFDVVIVTYPVLRSDFNIAHAAPDRPRRADVMYSNVERPRSPLLMCEWFRVVMDEVQMVGGGKIADMVSLIPRLSSFAVSGTPARAQVSDLWHVLKFLRLDDLIGSPKLWNRFISPGFGAGYFAALFQECAIRTLKANIKDELTIPPQTRFLVSIPLGPVEKHVYDQTLEEVLLELRLDARGVAAEMGWQVDGALLRASLRKLRGICTHPQIGQLQTGVVKTIEDVLQNMKDANWRKMMDDQKSEAQVLIRIAQLQNRDEGNKNRFQHALDTLLQAERQAEGLAREVKSALSKFLPHAKEHAPASRAGPSQTSKAKGRAVSESLPEPLWDTNWDNDEGVSSRDSPLSREARQQKRSALQNRLRECRLTLHRVKFFQGDMYHCLGEGHGLQEDAAYVAAEEIRRELLKGSEQEASRAMSLLEHDATKHGLTLDALLVEAGFVDTKDIIALVDECGPTNAEMDMKASPRKITFFNQAKKSLELVNEVNTIAEGVLNKQSALMWEWRTEIVALLTTKLSHGDDEKADGEEYQRTLDCQGEAEIYLQCYALLLSDRRQAILNERTLLAEHEAQEKKQRQTKVARNVTVAAGLENADSDDLLDIQDLETNGEHEALLSELQFKRKILLERLRGRAVKSVLIDLNTTMSNAGNTDPEKSLLEKLVYQLRGFVTEQGSLMDKLEADLTLIRKAFNQRILYFRQLQEISDSVAEVQWDGILQDALMQSILDKTELESDVKRSLARQRYLDNLTGNNDGVIRDDGECCILCRCEFVRGSITKCAHMFCETCMRAWLHRKEGKTCPVCRVPIGPNDIEQFTVNDRSAESSSQHMEPIPQSKREISYNTIDPQLLEEINSMESYGDYGSKIQTLVRHLLYLKYSEVTCKSIVFSTWAETLYIVQRALKENGIQCLRIDQKIKGHGAVKMFKNNPDMAVLLLHGERENAGLNITCASRVFLLESVVHHGFELQAIARIDRMGQLQPTEVYCYYAEGTVERNILDLAARKGSSLYTKDNFAGTLSASSLIVDVEEKANKSPKKKTLKGDFIFKVDEMLAVLFPHMYEDLEYLLPNDRPQ